MAEQERGAPTSAPKMKSPSIGRFLLMHAYIFILGIFLKYMLSSYKVYSLWTFLWMNWLWSGKWWKYYSESYAENKAVILLLLVYISLNLSTNGESSFWPFNLSTSCFTAEEDFEKDFLISWKPSKPGKQTMDLDVETVPQNRKSSFNFDKLLGYILHNFFTCSYIM